MVITATAALLQHQRNYCTVTATAYATLDRDHQTLGQRPQKIARGCITAGRRPCKPPCHSLKQAHGTIARTCSLLQVTALKANTMAAATALTSVMLCFFRAVEVTFKWATGFDCFNSEGFSL